MTKGVAGLLGLPALLVAAAITGHLKQLLRRHDLYYTAVSSLLVIGSYYISRELAAPGYLQAVWENELGGRAFGALENHSESVGWYWSLLAEEKFPFWLGLALVGLFLGLRQPKATPEYRLAVCAGLWISWYLGLLSMMQTKLTWYDAPIYPVLALLAAVGIWLLVEAAATYFQLPLTRPWVLLCSSLLLLYGPYAHLMVHNTTHYRHRYWEAEAQFGRFLAWQQKELPDLETYALLSSVAYNGSVEWYCQMAQTQYQHHVELRNNDEIAQLPPNSVVVVCDGRIARQLMRERQTQLVLRQDSCATLKILR